jgi:hypothetical protein
MLSAIVSVFALVSVAAAGPINFGNAVAVFKQSSCEEGQSIGVVNQQFDCTACTSLFSFPPFFFRCRASRVCGSQCLVQC